MPFTEDEEDRPHCLLGATSLKPSEGGVTQAVGCRFSVEDLAPLRHTL